MLNDDKITEKLFIIIKLKNNVLVSPAE